MSDQNKPPIPFSGASAIPIVGQPCKMLAFVPNFLFQCNCEGKHPLLAVGQGAAVKCPGCGNTYMAASIAFDARTMHLNVAIARVFTQAEAAAALPTGQA